MTVTVNVPATAKKDDVAKIVLRVTGTSAANANATTGFDGSITVNVTEKSEPILSRSRPSRVFRR